MPEIDVLDVHFSFTERPSDLPADLRPNWRIPLLLLMLNLCCRGGKSSLFRLHVLNWSIRDEENRAQLLANVEGNLEYSRVPIRVEPAFVRAIQFAVGERLLHRISGDRVELAEKGRSLAQDVLSNASLFTEEKRFLETVGLRLTENWVKGFSKWGRA